METGTYWGVVDPETLESFQELGLREQSAVKLALVDIKRWKDTGIEPNPMKVTIASERSFATKLFANVMHELGVDVASSYQRNEIDGSITFQPKPYNKKYSSRVSVYRPRDSKGEFLKPMEEYLQGFKNRK